MKGNIFYQIPENVRGYIDLHQEEGSEPLALRIIGNIIKSTTHQNFSENNQVLIDYGCAHGRSIIELTRILGFKRAIGVDVSKGLLDAFCKRAPKEIPHTEITTFQVDLETKQSPIPSNISNLAVCIGTAMYISDMDNLFLEASRVLKIGGIFCTTIATHIGPRGKTLFRGRIDAHVFNDKEILSLINKSNFVIENYSFKRPVDYFNDNSIETTYFLKKI